MFVQYVAYAFCIVCAFGALAGFGAAAHALLCIAAKKLAGFVQRTNTAEYVPNRPLPAHTVR
jgi:hypothetical protein